MKLSTRQELLNESNKELKRLRKLAGLNEAKNPLNEETSVMPTVAKIRKVQYSLEYLDKWLRGEPGHNVKNATSTFQQLEKAIGDIKKFTLEFEKELRADTYEKYLERKRKRF